MHFKKKVCLSFFSLQKKEKERVGGGSSSAKLMHGLSLLNSTYWLCALYAVHFPPIHPFLLNVCTFLLLTQQEFLLHSLIISHPKLEGKKGATVASINLPNSLAGIRAIHGLRLGGDVLHRYSAITSKGFALAQHKLKPCIRRRRRHERGDRPLWCSTHFG